MQGMQVSYALLLGLLKVAAEEAQCCHASQYILHHCLLPCCLQHHSEITNNNNNLQAFQLIVLARYLLGVPNPSPVSQHALT